MSRKTSTNKPCKVFLVLAVPALSLVAIPAHAEVGGQVAADLDLGGTMDARPLAVGAGGRFGWRFDLGPIWLQPEALGGYTAFLGEVCDSCILIHQRAVRALGGLRIGGSGLVSGVIEPAIFGHGGYGWAWTGIGFPTDPLKGPAFDVGAAFDVKVVRYFRFGAHGAYNAVLANRGGPTYQGGGGFPAVKWLSFGLHAGVTF